MQQIALKSIGLSFFNEFFSAVGLMLIGLSLAYFLLG
jgi:ABC-type sulfate transport system permease component